MAYSIQLLKEATAGRHNITDWLKQFITQIDEEDIQQLRDRALLFITEEKDDIASEARVKELLYFFDDTSSLVEAIVNALCMTIVAIKPDWRIRAGVPTPFAGVLPIQAVATQIGFHLHKDQIDAVLTGMDILASFADIGMYNLMFGTADDLDTGVVQSNFSGPDLDKLQSMIKATQYLPPLIIHPLTIT